MINWKALLAGFFTVIFLGLTFQLIFIMLDVGYNLLMNSYPAIKDYKQVFYYIIGLPGFFPLAEVWLEKLACPSSKLSK